VKDAPVSTDVTGGPSPTRAHDGRTMIGHVVLCHGHDSTNHESVAVWHVNTDGIGTGAWIVPIILSDPDPAVARRILRLSLQRAVVAWEPAHTIALLTTLREAASVARPDWSDSAVALPDALGEIVLTRSAYEKQTVDEQLVKKHIVPIEWPVDLPDHAPATEDDLWTESRLVLPETSPVARAALRTTMLARWSVLRWQETMTALGRRIYLKQTFGPPCQLPPHWESRLADAYADNRALIDH
jgi:hypothetical protein